ncbi:MAG: glycerophosphodiester phosphodiesterase [Chromatiales bacterium]|jgi:glycerophosphoryl diester phosphodiesterase|nr:glycerophosphodiester phosphodiesterase [Chromatiales bacterium]MDP6150569.1 glycerophosphodiester phosphodiesterase family protein [Gammaproteobacteria bacterium]MDP7092945.1 glycerophosphodiester phosphodiesterase family protein [Gammaproteobacteria bacterium]MDP7270199.1 glycerophosphodiester phosphodiesterase family protein [Gammaproteobacteria bacterium]HJP04274.1 glycerophosphodiester phosphodiesterase family protein [Gammaproteobacteria bacterium]
MTDTSGPETVALLAHRGYAAHYPENTLEAMQAAVDAGATLLEFDIQLSRDLVPFLLHDADFKRTAGVEKSAFDLGADEIAAMPVGEEERLGEGFRDVRPPTLLAMVEALAGWKHVTAFVEVKGESIKQFGLEVVLAAVLPVITPVLEQCVVISFDADYVREVRARTGRPIGWAIRTWNEESHELAGQLMPDYLFCNHIKMPAELWAGPWIWVAYEITKPEMAQELAARGVSIFETMWFAEMHTALNTASDK